MPFPNLSGREPVYSDEAAKNKLIEYYSIKVDENGDIPTAAGLAGYMGVSKDTIQSYSKNEDKNHEQFSVSYKIMMALQEDGLLQGGLKGKLNSNVVKLALMNHGYSEKTQTENTNTNLNTEIKEDSTKSTAEKLQEVLLRIKTVQDDKST